MAADDASVWVEPHPYPAAAGPDVFGSTSARDDPQSPTSSGGITTANSFFCPAANQ